MLEGQAGAIAPTRRAARRTSRREVLGTARPRSRDQARSAQAVAPYSDPARLATSSVKRGRQPLKWLKPRADTLTAAGRAEDPARRVHGACGCRKLRFE